HSAPNAAGLLSLANLALPLTSPHCVVPSVPSYHTSPGHSVSVGTANPHATTAARGSDSPGGLRRHYLSPVPHRFEPGRQRTRLTQWPRIRAINVDPSDTIRDHLVQVHRSQLLTSPHVLTVGTASGTTHALHRWHSLRAPVPSHP